MRVEYHGPHAEGVYIPMPDGSEIACAREVAVEVPDELGASLLEQPGNWRRSTNTKAAAAAAKE